MEEVTVLQHAKHKIKRSLSGAEEGEDHKEQHRDTHNCQEAWSDVLHCITCNAKQTIEHQIPLIGHTCIDERNTTIHNAHLAKDKQHKRKHWHKRHKRIERQGATIDHRTMDINTTQRIVYQAIAPAQVATLRSIHTQQIVVYDSLQIFQRPLNLLYNLHYCSSFTSIIHVSPAMVVRATSLSPPGRVAVARRTASIESAQSRFINSTPSPFHLRLSSFGR